MMVGGTLGFTLIRASIISLASGMAVHRPAGTGPRQPASCTAWRIVGALALAAALLVVAELALLLRARAATAPAALTTPVSLAIAAMDATGGGDGGGGGGLLRGMPNDGGLRAEAAAAAEALRVASVQLAALSARLARCCEGSASGLGAASDVRAQPMPAPLTQPGPPATMPPTPPGYVRSARGGYLYPAMPRPAAGEAKKRLIFTVSTGKTGTVWLVRALR